MLFDPSFPSVPIEQLNQCSREWLHTLNKYEIVGYLNNAVASLGAGEHFTLAELLPGTWELLNPNARMQAEKAFKIMVSRKLINTVYFRPNKNRQGNFVYVRRE